MTIPEAIDLAVKALREKADIERIQLHMVERAPSIARQIDPHAYIRHRKYVSAIRILHCLKSVEMDIPADLAEGEESIPADGGEA